jgi:hypothetical protein
MRTKLTLLAVLASAPFLANAQSTAPAMSSTATAANVQTIPAGNEPLNMAPAMKTPSEKTRAGVEANAADAAKTGTISSGNQPLGPMVSPHSTTTRAVKSREGAAAVDSGNLATGNEPIVGSPNEKLHSQMKSTKNQKKMSNKDMQKSRTTEAVKAGNEPYAKTPSAMSGKTRSEVNAETSMSGGADAVKSGNQPLAPRTSAMSTQNRADVKAAAATAVRNDTLKTGDGAAKPAN